MDLPNRKSPRLTGFDYSSENSYFVTICTKSKKCLFGTVDHLNIYGQIAENGLRKIPNKNKEIKLDKYIIMPNHIHAIITIGCNRAIRDVEEHENLSMIVGLYKSGVSREIHKFSPGLEIWQKSFYDHIIRNESAYYEICRYIDENPVRWKYKNSY